MPHANATCSGTRKAISQSVFLIAGPISGSPPNM